MTEPHDWHDLQETSTTAEGGRCLTEADMEADRDEPCRCDLCVKRPGYHAPINRRADRNSELRAANREARERNARVARKSAEISDFIMERLGQ